jgi:hypothetical protein
MEKPTQETLMKALRGEVVGKEIASIGRALGICSICLELDWLKQMFQASYNGEMNAMVFCGECALLEARKKREGVTVVISKYNL